jgi:hypothetical protein
MQSDQIPHLHLTPLNTTNCKGERRADLHKRRWLEMPMSTRF